MLSAALETDVLAKQAWRHTRWPKPRAAIALDVTIFSSSRNGARVDSVCKWLLDELNGKVYADDRQVKLLFARLARPLPTFPRDRADGFWQEVVDKAGTSRKKPTTMYVTAQTRASVLADLRVAANLEERWDPFYDDHGVGRDPLYASIQRDMMLDYQSLFDPDGEESAHRHRQIGHQIDYHDQTQQQRIVDMVFSSLLTDLPVDRFNIWNQVRDRLTYSPYIFDLGTLPERGQSASFQQRLLETLEYRRDRYPGLFPMRATSGITMVLFEEPRSGKDLDNLVRSILPAVLNTLRPPEHDLPGWIAEEPDPAGGGVDIPFVEVAAFPSKAADMPPGSVIFGLSGGQRFNSWWHQVGEYAERVLEDDYRF